jgi:hypothetical protein
VNIVSGAFELYGERNFYHFKNVLDTILKHNSRLTRIYKKSVFASVSFNLGERSCCIPHTDQGNIARGWCSITPVGSFNPDDGGHLIFWDLGIAVRFPAGATILIPSALLVHSNATMASGDRMCMVQFTCGELDHFVANGCQSKADWLDGKTEVDKAQRAADDKERCQKTCDSFMKLHEIYKE